MLPFLKLPNSGSRGRQAFNHVRLVSEVRPDAWNAAGFVGTIHRPGATVPLNELGSNPILVECAGTQGAWRRGKQRETLWILWRYDWGARDWREIARALAFDSSWALALRAPAIRALRPAELPLVDPIERGREVTDELLHAIDAALVTELPAVRAVVLTSIYDRVAGRIVAA